MDLGFLGSVLQRKGTDTSQAECRGFESHHPLPHLTPPQISTESVHKPPRSICPGLPKADASTFSRFYRLPRADSR